MKNLTVKYWYLLFLLAGLNWFTPISAQLATTALPSPSADIEVFVRNGCPHCAAAEVFLQKLQQSHPGLRVTLRHIDLDATALQQLEALAAAHQQAVRVPAFRVGGELIIGYSAEATDALILQALSQAAPHNQPTDQDTGSCGIDTSLSCETHADHGIPSPPAGFTITLFDRHIDLDQVGLPLFTLALGFLDGFNPCSFWVLILMISMLAPMHNRWRMLAIAGTFVLVEGLAYFVFMTAWLNLFLLIGMSHTSALIIAGLAILAGLINLKDFWAFGKGFSLSIPASAKPGIYARMRAILQAENLTGAMLAAVVLAVLVQLVELMCTSGFPALYTRILTLQHLDSMEYYGYLLLYNLAYLIDDVVILLIGIITLSQKRLQEQEGRWLKLLSGAVMLGLGIYLLWTA